MAKANGRDARQPWMKFFTRDWRSNARLRMCSYAARGLWIDIISLMAEAEHFGFLIINGVVPTCRQLAGLLGGTEKEITKLRAELGDANVYSVTGFDIPDDVRRLIPEGMPEGVIFSRRMLRDKAKAEKDRANGSNGGNPKLIPVRIQVMPGVNPKANPQSQRPESRDQITETDLANGTDPARGSALGGGSAPRALSASDIRMAELAAQHRNKTMKAH